MCTISFDILIELELLQIVTVRTTEHFTKQFMFNTNVSSS